jgi:hypothetical protein
MNAMHGISPSLKDGIRKHTRSQTVAWERAPRFF